MFAINRSNVTRRLLAATILLLSAGNICHAQDNTTAPAAAAIDTQTARDDRPGWFRDARFGMFVHWGP